MKCVRFAYAGVTLVFLVGCSGKFNVGQEPASNGGSPAASAGTSSSAAGSTVVGIGDDSAGGASTGVGGGDPTSAAGATATAGAPAAAIEYCGQILPVTTPPVTFASTTVLWSRIQLFLMGDVKASPIPVGLPVTPTRDLAGALADATLDSLNGTPAPGLARFVSAWWPGTPNADAWATLFGDPKATLTDLLTTNAVLNPGSGVLTDLAVLKRAQIPARGQFLDEHLLCIQVPPPPPSVPELPPTQSGETRREQLQAHRVNPACSSCHAIIDPIGLALENYDAAGMFSKLDNGAPIDSSGTLSTGMGTSITFSNVNDLGAKLAQQCGVSTCLTQQLLADAETSANLPIAGSTDPVVVDSIALTASGGSLRDLIHGIVESDTFMRAK